MTEVIATIAAGAALLLAAAKVSEEIREWRKVVKKDKEPPKPE